MSAWAAVDLTMRKFDLLDVGRQAGIFSAMLAHRNEVVSTHPFLMRKKRCFQKTGAEAFVLEKLLTLASSLDER